MDSLSFSPTLQSFLLIQSTYGYGIHVHASVERKREYVQYAHSVEIERHM